VSIELGPTRAFQQQSIHIHRLCPARTNNSHPFNIRPLSRRDVHTIKRLCVHAPSRSAQFALELALEFNTSVPLGHVSRGAPTLLVGPTPAASLRNGCSSLHLFNPLSLQGALAPPEPLPPATSAPHPTQPPQLTSAPRCGAKPQPPAAVPAKEREARSYGPAVPEGGDTSHWSTSWDWVRPIRSSLCLRRSSETL